MQSTFSLKSRIAAVSSRSTVAPVMYSAAGAQFQEWAMQYVTADNKATLVKSGLVGELVTAINNNRMTVDQAVKQFNNALYADFR